MTCHRAGTVLQERRERRDDIHDRNQTLAPALVAQILVSRAPSSVPIVSLVQLVMLPPAKCPSLRHRPVSPEPRYRMISARQSTRDWVRGNAMYDAVASTDERAFSTLALAPGVPSAATCNEAQDYCESPLLQASDINRLVCGLSLATSRRRTASLRSQTLRHK